MGDFLDLALALGDEGVVGGECFLLLLLAGLEEGGLREGEVGFGGLHRGIGVRIGNVGGKGPEGGGYAGEVGQRAEFWESLVS